MNALARTAMRTVLPRYEVLLQTCAQNCRQHWGLDDNGNERAAVGSLAQFQVAILQRDTCLPTTHDYYPCL
eukprot:scaffold8284_cov145-Skeletonema_menzelii.AAC.1